LPQGKWNFLRFAPQDLLGPSLLNDGKDNFTKTWRDSKRFTESSSVRYPSIFNGDGAMRFWMLELRLVPFVYGAQASSNPLDQWRKGELAHPPPPPPPPPYSDATLAPQFKELGMSNWWENTDWDGGWEIGLIFCGRLDCADFLPKFTGWEIGEKFEMPELAKSQRAGTAPLEIADLDGKLGLPDFDFGK